MQKIELLEKAVHEFMQRVQYHHKTWRSEDLQIDTSKRLNKMRNMKNFTPDKTWIKGISDAVKNHNKGTQEASLECIEIEDEDHLDAQPKINHDQRKSPPKSPQTSIVNLVFDDVEIKSDLDDVIFDLVNNKTKERDNKTTFRIRRLHGQQHGEKTAVIYRVQLKDKKIKLRDFHDDLCVSAIHKTPALKTYSVRRKKASSNGEINSATKPVVKPATTDQNITTKKTLSLEDQVQIIDDYDRKLTVLQIAEMFNCELEDIKKIIQNRGVIMDCHHSHLTNSMSKEQKQDQIQVLRKHKITLERALYEYIRRSQYHRQMPLNEDLLIRVALDLNGILNIDQFNPNKKWLKDFMLHFNISTSHRMIVVENKPPASLDLRDILNYCHRCYERKQNQLSNTTETTTAKDVNDEEHEDADMEELNVEAVKQQIDQAQIGNDLLSSDQTTLSNEQMEIEQTLETLHDNTEVDTEQIVMDIKIEQPEVQTLCESTVRRLSKELAEEASEPPILKTATTSPIVDSNSDDDEVMPKVTNSYEEALKKLKSLEEFALLEENYRAIGLITQLESIFKNPPIREK